MMATSALVGGTVESHSSPITIEKAITLVGRLRQEQEGGHRDRTGDIDQARKIGFE